MKTLFDKLSNVLRRELPRIKAHPRYLILATLGIAFSYLFFLTLMRDGQPQKLPIAIVDEDGSYFSRRLCHEIEATQGVRVARVYNSHKEARAAMQRQEIYAFLHIPHGTYNDVLAFKAPHVVLYANNAYLLSGTLSYKQLMTICNLAAGAVQREVLRKKGMGEEQIMGLIMPIEIDAHLVGNPMANYQSYLLTTILPGILGLMAILLTVFSIGMESREGTAGEWLSAADGRIGVALVGKLLPYACWFIALQLLGNLVLFGFCQFPMQGHYLTLALCSVLFVLAMMSAGVFLYGLIPQMTNAICFSAFYGILAFSLSGFTYPVSGMARPLQALSVIFPLRQNYLVYVNEALFGLPLSYSYGHLCILVLFLLLPLITNSRIKKQILSHENAA